MVFYLCNCVILCVDWMDVNSGFLFLGNEIPDNNFSFYVCALLLSLNSLEQHMSILDKNNIVLMIWSAYLQILAMIYSRWYECE